MMMASYEYPVLQEFVAAGEITDDVDIHEFVLDRTGAVEGFFPFISDAPSEFLTIGPSKNNWVVDDAVFFTSPTPDDAPAHATHIVVGDISKVNVQEQVLAALEYAISLTHECDHGAAGEADESLDPCLVRVGVLHVGCNGNDLLEGHEMAHLISSAAAHLSTGALHGFVRELLQFASDGSVPSVDDVAGMLPYNTEDAVAERLTSSWKASKHVRPKSIASPMTQLITGCRRE